MKFLKWILPSIFIFSTMAQDTLTVVAVGEAETEKEKIYFETALKKSELNADQEKKLELVAEILKSDFDFYRSKYEVQGNKSNETKYLAEVRISGEKEFQLKIKLENLKDKKVLLETKVKVDFNKIRQTAHDVSDQIYTSLTGKKSIFKTQIYFVSDRTSRGSDIRKELYVMDFDGANRKRLTYFNSILISPSLSADNTKAVYTLIEDKTKPTGRGDGSFHNVKNLNLHMMDLKTKKSRLVSNIDGINSGAVFSKSGESIYLTLSYQKNADIYQLNLANGYKKKITSHYSDDVDPHINADGSLMTFLSGRAGKAMIYTLDPKGREKNVKRISFVGRFNAAPRFNPDGTEIVFSSWVDDRFDIYRIGSNGENLVRLTKNFGSNEEPWFSPDGQFIVFTSQRVITRKRATQDVYIMDRDGEIIRKITSDYGKIFSPRWSNL